MSVKEKTKIGKFLVERNFITSEQAEQILELQKHNPAMRFEEIALELGYFDSSAMNQYKIYIHSEK